jgi:hypothetical protein
MNFFLFPIFKIGKTKINSRKAKGCGILMTVVLSDDYLDRASDLNQSRTSKRLRKYNSHDSHLNLIDLEWTKNNQKPKNREIILDPLGAYLKQESDHRTSNVKANNNEREKLFDYRPFDITTDDSCDQQKVEEFCDCENCTGLKSDGTDPESISDGFQESDVEYESNETDDEEVEIEGGDFKPVSISNALSSIMRLTIKNPIEITSKIQNVKSFTSDKLKIIRNQIQKQLPNSLSQQELTNKIKSSISGYAFNSSFLTFNGSQASSSKLNSTQDVKENGI